MLVCGGVVVVIFVFLLEGGGGYVVWCLVGDGLVF